MLETSAWLLRLLALLQARRDWPGPDLADRHTRAARHQQAVAPSARG